MRGKPGARRTVVLLVDDSADNRAMYAEYLAFAGFRVLEAANGVEGIATARANRPDVVVMDVMLPELDGCEATKALRADATTKDIRVLALSGRCDDAFKARVLQSGVDRFVEKPCLPHELVAHLRELVASR